MVTDVAEVYKYEVVCASEQYEIENLPSRFRSSLVFMDIATAGENSAGMFECLSIQAGTAKIVLVCGSDESALARAIQSAMSLGINIAGTIRKPISIDALRHTLNKSKRASYAITPSDIEGALDDDEIRPAYQPKATRSPDGKWHVTEVEALARWHRSDRKTVLPSEFIDIAERSSLLPRMTRSILRHVVQQLVDWDDRGLRLSAAINISPSLLTSMEIVDELENTMRAKHLDNSRLTLELTESEAIRNPKMAISILTAIRNKGFGLSIDDFGSGYSSLEQLYRLPFTELKIDRYMVREISTRNEVSTVIESIITLGHKLGLEICAEGVESLAAFRQLCDLGCDKLQGYYIGRPTRAENIQGRTMEFGTDGFAQVEMELAQVRDRRAADRSVIDSSAEPSYFRQLRGGISTTFA